MSISPRCTPKRKREQSVEAPKVRRSARQEAKLKPNESPESVMEHAMRLKKVQSLEFNPSRSSRTSQQGSDPAVQADSAGKANVLQSAPAATSGRMNKSRVTSCCFIGDRAAFADKKRVAEESPQSLKPLVHASQRSSILSSKDKGLAIPPLTRVPKVDAQGKHSASRSTRVPQTNACTHTLLSDKNCTKNSSETSDALKHHDPHVNNGPKNHQIEKPMSSKLEPCMTGNIKIEGIRSAIQADRSGSATAVKPASATSTKRVNQSTIAGPSRTTIHDAQAASRSVANADPSDPSLVSHNSQRISPLSSNGKDSTCPASTMVAARVASQGYQRNSIHSGMDKGVLPLSSPPMTRAPDVPAHGRRSSVSHAVPQSGVGISKLMSENSHTGGMTESNHVSQNAVHHKNNLVEKKNLNENEAIRAAPNLSKMSVQPPGQLNPTFYIRSKGSSELSASPPSLWPLGERCGLCGIDLAFMAKGSDSQSGDLPFSAVLPCRHSYHDTCLRDVFGPVEPVCVCCLESVAPQGS